MKAKSIWNGRRKAGVKTLTSDHVGFRVVVASILTWKQEYLPYSWIPARCRFHPEDSIVGLLFTWTGVTQASSEHGVQGSEGEANEQLGGNHICLKSHGPHFCSMSDMKYT